MNALLRIGFVACLLAAAFGYYAGSVLGDDFLSRAFIGGSVIVLSVLILPLFLWSKYLKDDLEEDEFYRGRAMNSSSIVDNDGVREIPPSESQKHSA